MVEVFKTNVSNARQAHFALEQLHRNFSCKATFDLEDCDKILRVLGPENELLPDAFIRFLQQLGIQAEVLPD